MIPKVLIEEAIRDGKCEFWGTGGHEEPTSDQYKRYEYPIAKEKGGTEIHMMWTDTPCRVTCWGGGGEVMDAFRNPKIECVVAQHPWLENDVLCADIVLPTATTLELDDISPCIREGDSFQSVVLMNAAIEPVGEARSDYHAIHNSGRRPLSAVHLIVLHDMEVALYDEAAEAVGRYFESKASGGSTNYGVDNNSIQCYLQDSIIPWGAPYANTAGLHIEQMGKASWTTAQWHKLAAGTLDRTAWLIAQKSKKLGIPIRTLTDAQVKAGSKGIVTHKQVTRAYGVYGGHTDPGDGYPLGFVLDLAKKYA